MVSIVVPVYNVREYLVECVESLLGQTYGDIEVILVDDGSTDGSGALCDEYAAKEERVKVIHKKNGGLSDARNAGLEIARGEFVTLVDSDDFVSADFIEKLLEKALSENAEMVVAGIGWVDENSREMPGAHSKSPETIRGKHECFRSYLTGKQIGVVAWGKLYRRELLEGIRYPVGKYHEDVFTTYKIVARCTAVAIVPDAVYHYRQRSGSILHQEFSMKHLDAIEAKEECWRFVSEHFPELRVKGSADVVYAANHCVVRLVNADSKVRNREVWERISSAYRSHGRDYLRSGAPVPQKAFALLAWLSPRMFVGACRALRLKF